MTSLVAYGQPLLPATVHTVVRMVTATSVLPTPSSVAALVDNTPKFVYQQAPDTSGTAEHSAPTDVCLVDSAINVTQEHAVAPEQLPKFVLSQVGSTSGSKSLVHLAATTDIATNVLSLKSAVAERQPKYVKRIAQDTTSGPTSYLVPTATDVT